MIKNTQLFTLMLICLYFCSCATIQKNRYKKLDTEHRTDVKSKHNDDNIILVEGKEYLYKVVQKDKDRTLKFDLALKTVPGNYSGGTKIKYKHYYKDEFLTKEEKRLYLDTVKHYKWDITSAHENADEFHLHPSRSYTLKKLEITPFPELSLPPIKGRYSYSVNNIVAGYGEYNMSRIYSAYQIGDVIYNSDSSFIAKIKASSNWKKEVSDEKICNTYFVFDSKLGFTKMDYFFTDGTAIEITMEK